jgi:predicted PhzF superfamily epimerase YddE/YHI9
MRFGYRIVNVFTQGAQAGRPSTLQLRIDGDRRVFVAGEVVELGRGYVEL